jgi:hypothetical protein
MPRRTIPEGEGRYRRLPLLFWTALLGGRTVQGRKKFRDVLELFHSLPGEKFKNVPELFVR